MLDFFLVQSNVIDSIFAKFRKPTVEPILPHSWQNNRHFEKFKAAKIRLGENWILHPDYVHNPTHSALHGVTLQAIKANATAQGRI